jgi:hypothetical protein
VPDDQKQEQPPPLEANDMLVTAVVTACWAVALIVLLIIRTDLPSGSRWWIWTCVTGTAMGLFGLWYVPRLKRSRARAAARRAAATTSSSASAGRPEPGGTG